VDRGDGVEVRPNSIRLFFVWNGKRHKETLTRAGKPLAPTAGNIAHARRQAAEIRRRITLGTFELAEFFPDSKRAEVVATAATTFGEMCALYLKTKGRLAKKTLDQYRNALEVWKSLLGTDQPIAELTHGKVASIIGSHGWASNKLLNNYLIPLRGTFALAGRDLKIEDPTDGIENGKHQAPPPDPLSQAETEAILFDLWKHYHPQIWTYFEFAFMTGMRPEELIALRWSDVDWNHGTIRVERAKTSGQVKPLKTYQTRDVDLVERAVKALQEQKAHTFMLDGEVFHNPVTGRPWHDERSQRDHYWKPALRRLGVRDRRAYQTRHTYATTALAAGVNPTYISRQMGHKSAKMLFSVYAKWIDGADRGREKAKLEALLASAQVPRQSPGETPIIGRRDWTRTKSRGAT
jgi:integrase